MKSLLPLLFLLFSSTAMAQDWDKRYRNWRTAGYVSSVAPVVGIAGGTAMIAAAKDKPIIITVLLVGGGVFIGTAGVVGGTPLMALSASQGRRALRMQGAQVSGTAGSISWVGAGVGTTGLGMLATGAVLKDGNSLIGVGIVTALAGSVIAYSAGATQWGVNGRARREQGLKPERAPVPLRLSISGRW